MARAKGERSYLNLAKGLNTESNPLNFPEGYTTDEVNFLLSLGGGTRVRRKGLQKATSDSLYTSTVGENNVKDYAWFYWEQADLILVALTDDDLARVVVCENDATRTVLGEFTMGTLSTSNQIVPSFSKITDGVVITSGDAVTGEASPPHVLSINEEGNIEVSEIVLYFRDFELIDDLLPISRRPSTLGLRHNYNLLNAGWYAERKNSSGKLVDPLTLFEGSDITLNVSDFSADSTAQQFSFVSLSPSAVASIEVGTNITVSGTASAGANDGVYTVQDVTVVTEEGPNPDPDPDPRYDPPVTYTYTLTVLESVPANETDTAGVQVEYTVGAYPSNADLPLNGLRSDGTGDYKFFSPDTMFETVLGNTEAPRGHYIYDVNSERVREDSITNKNDDGSPSTTLTLKQTITRP